ncbi:hypothetical protein ACIBKX_16695 [Streptomyces sp. NPDC050658]|uniref:hypothetical protein n=1 Tax=unclassified Streptomyces TaxID=2593676 RepID=UPI00342B1757
MTESPHRRDHAPGVSAEDITAEGITAESITVQVSAAPDPFLLRPLIAARLAGRPVPPGPEALVAEAVAARVRREAGPWH